MVAKSSTETSVIIYQSRWHHTPEDLILYPHRRENFKLHIINTGIGEMVIIANLSIGLYVKFQKLLAH
jgi:hypothetical protein